MWFREVSPTLLAHGTGLDKLAYVGAHGGPAVVGGSKSADCSGDTMVAAEIIMELLQ